MTVFASVTARVAATTSSGVAAASRRASGQQRRGAIDLGARSVALPAAQRRPCLGDVLVHGGEAGSWSARLPDVRSACGRVDGIEERRRLGDRGLGLLDLDDGRVTVVAARAPWPAARAAVAPRQLLLRRVRRCPRRPRSSRPRTADQSSPRTLPSAGSTRAACAWTARSSGAGPGRRSSHRSRSVLMRAIWSSTSACALVQRSMTSWSIGAPLLGRLGRLVVELLAEREGLPQLAPWPGRARPR